MGVVKMSCFGGGGTEDEEGLKEQKRQNKIIDQQLRKEKKAYKALHRLLLLGNTHTHTLIAHVYTHMLDVVRQQACIRVVCK